MQGHTATFFFYLDVLDLSHLNSLLKALDKIFIWHHKLEPKKLLKCWHRSVAIVVKDTWLVAIR